MNPEDIKKLTDSIPRTIMTPRMEITLLKLRDVPDVTKSLRESWDEMHEWVRWADKIESLQLPEQLERASRNMKAFEEGDSYYGVSRLRATGEIGPQVTLYFMNQDTKEGHGGYWTPTKLTGQGLTIEAMAAILHLGFDYYGLKKIHADHGDGNEASAHILKKLGFEWKKIVPNGSLGGNGKVRDEHIYELSDKNRIPTIPDLTFV